MKRSKKSKLHRKQLGEAATDDPYAILKDRVFAHTQDFDPTLLEKIGMDFEFASILYALGWEEFVPVTKLGSWPLTIQFLCFLVIRRQTVSSSDF
jgi:hypothetical protein